MSRISKTIGATLGSALLIASGVALADTQQTAQTTPPTPQNPPAMERGMKVPPVPAMKAPDLSSIRPGANVISAAGSKVGEVSAIDGNLVIVKIGGILGIGAHDVALQKSQYEIIGSGRAAQLRTMLTKAELEKMPEYKKM